MWNHPRLPQKKAKSKGRPYAAIAATRPTCGLICNHKSIFLIYFTLNWAIVEFTESAALWDICSSRRRFIPLNIAGLHVSYLALYTGRKNSWKDPWFYRIVVRYWVSWIWWNLEASWRQKIDSGTTNFYWPGYNLTIIRVKIRPNQTTPILRYGMDITTIWYEKIILWQVVIKNNEHHFWDTSMLHLIFI